MVSVAWLRRRGARPHARWALVVARDNHRRICIKTDFAFVIPNWQTTKVTNHRLGDHRLLVNRPVEFRAGLPEWGHEPIGDIDDGDACRDRVLAPLVDDFVR